MAQGGLANKEDYLSYTNKADGCKRLGFGKQHVKYTITEAIKVFQIALTKEGKTKSKSASFWLQVERSQILPKRTADSLRNFWKTVEKSGLENYMRQALETNTWYCHAFCKIPKVKMICSANDDGSLEVELIRLAEDPRTISTNRQLAIMKNSSKFS